MFGLCPLFATNGELSSVMYSTGIVPGKVVLPFSNEFLGPCASSIVRLVTPMVIRKKGMGNLGIDGVDAWSRLSAVGLCSVPYYIRTLFFVFFLFNPFFRFFELV